jgi:hypothetical protein
VQAPLIRYAEQVGWTYVAPQDAVALRKGKGGLLFNRILEERLIKLNPGVISEGNVEEIIRRIEEAPNSIEGNAEILGWLRGEQAVFIESENCYRNVAVIEFSDLSKNIFQVTDEWQYTNGQETNRADVMFLINGIPVAIVETKNAAKTKGIEEALIQIREYHNETPEMLTAPQVFDLTHLIDFYYGVTWNTDSKNLFKWHASNGPPLRLAQGRRGPSPSQNLRNSVSSVVKSSPNPAMKALYLVRMDTENDNEQPETFETVVAKHEAALLRYAARIVSHSDAAQDIVQNTFIQRLALALINLLPVSGGAAFRPHAEGNGRALYRVAIRIGHLHGHGEPVGRVVTDRFYGSAMGNRHRAGGAPDNDGDTTGSGRRYQHHGGAYLHATRA